MDLVKLQRGNRHRPKGEGEANAQPQLISQGVHTEDNDSHDATPPLTVPRLIYDNSTGVTYKRDRLLGKGGFALCFEITEKGKEGDVVACKVVNKRLLRKPFQMQKMKQEISIHRDLNHPFVVNFISYFQDDANVYITMELCTNQSLLELQKRRRVITEPEAKYYLKQICQAVQYLHEEKHIIHRDLKLGNIFISANMCLKVGDFGLATKIEFDGHMRKSLCGTPNYIAPEVLRKIGHSYEADIWAVGCILYTLLFGRPPFESETLLETYKKIRRGEFVFPEKRIISYDAQQLLCHCLIVKAEQRPTARLILESDFMTHGHIPTHLPTSVLTMAPRFERSKSEHVPHHQAAEEDSENVGNNPQPVSAPPTAPIFKKPLLESNQIIGGSGAYGPTFVANTGSRPSSASSNANLNEEGNAFGGEIDILEHMKNLRDSVTKLIDSQPKITANDDENEDPSQAPMIWVCKWVDYSEKYGFGYQLSDESVAVFFNDATKMVLLPNNSSLHYIEKNGKEHYYSLEVYPDELSKKVQLVIYFKDYMNVNLLKATGGRTNLSPGIIARVPNIWNWFRTSRAVVMVLSNGTVQINNFRDHSKVIVCPLLGAVTTFRGSRLMRTFKLESMEANRGMTREMLDHLQYTRDKLNVLLERVTVPSLNQGSKTVIANSAPNSARKDQLQSESESQNEAKDIKTNPNQGRQTRSSTKSGK